MQKLISVITRKILEQIHPGEANMVRLENFEDPMVYRSVCEALRKNDKIDRLIPKLTLEKYVQFQKRNEPSWKASLIWLSQGDNLAYSDSPDEIYMNSSYVDFDQAITKWRNKSPDFPSGKTSLILLMGTEASPDDAGSLRDTTFMISPCEIISWFDGDYSRWFDDVLERNGISSDESRKALNTLYRTLFTGVNIDIFKLSNYVDSLETTSFSDCQELIDHICETLNTTWRVPSILDHKSVPKVRNLVKGTLSSAKIIQGAIGFINRADDIPSDSTIRKLREKFEKYAEENLVAGEEFQTGTAQFDSFTQFEDCVLDFMLGNNINTNREKLLRIDYALIDQIIGTKLPKKSSKMTPTTVYGSPMQAYSMIFLGVARDFKEKYSVYPINYTLRVDGISLPDCIDDEDEEAYKALCHFLGGILCFFDSADIYLDDKKIKFAYEEEIDPFDPKSFTSIAIRLKSTGKWGDPCKIKFTVVAENEDFSHSYEYKWSFSPYSPWLNAFTYLEAAFLDDSDCLQPPTLLACRNTHDFLSCESEDEFYSKLSQIDVDNLYQKQRTDVHGYFSDNQLCGIFDQLCALFEKFAHRLCDSGFYYALDELRDVVSTYTKLMDGVAENYSRLTDVQKEKIGFLINCFTITSNEKVFDNCDMGEVILPAYHPVMLEKIDAQQIFLRDGFAELITDLMENKKGSKKPENENEINAEIDSLVRLSSITQGVDAVISKLSVYLTCKGMWEYYGVYYNQDSSYELASGNSSGAAITDDEDARVMLHATPMSNIVVRNTLDYLKTFPSRSDGLNISFIAPTDMQHIVASMHMIAKSLEKLGVSSAINLNIICVGSRKNSASYLKRWLDRYFDDEKVVRVNTYLRNIQIGANDSYTDSLPELLKNCDLCFVYNILNSAGVSFDCTGEDKETVTRNQTKFPMTFTPDTIPKESGKARKISISQFQFLASKSHTQASHIVGNSNSLPGTYRTFETLELKEEQSRIIEEAHRACRWVVCIDPAIDRRVLESRESRIIGFTTGEGCYGELNVTVSARSDILSDIKNMLTRRLSEKFTNWDRERLKKAADFCVDGMSEYMDGSRILKALNPYDYEIHNYLAYILTLQILRLTKPDNDYALRTLINLDSYQHWFSDDEQDNKRPDFMLIEIPKSADNLDKLKKLTLNVKIIECKMGFEKDTQIEKATSQLEKGLRRMSMSWDPNNSGVRHRYFLNQLYRAIIFSPLELESNSVDYETIRNKIFGILSGDYEINWTGDIFAFWLDSDSDIYDEYELDSEVSVELSEKGIRIGTLNCHVFGQTFIQKMLVPPDERSADFIHNDIPNTEENIDLEFIDGDQDDEIAYSETEPIGDIHVTTAPTDEAAGTEVLTEDDGKANTSPEIVASDTPKAEEKCESVEHSHYLSSARFLIGEDLRTREKFYWEFGNKSLGNRHLLINGSSGCGKTYCIQTLLMEMVRAGVSGVVFDYTSGFTPDKLDPLFVSELGERLVQRVVYVNKIPVNPFAKQMIKVGGIETPEADTVVATRVANVFTSVYDFGGQQKSALYNAIKNGLKHHNGKMSFSYLEEELNAVSQKQAETVLSKIQPFLDLEPFTDDEEFSWGSIRDSGGMVYIMQLDGFDRPTQMLLTELLLWDIWNYCVKTGDEKHPFVIVMDEAQNLSHKEGSPSEKFLSEGRKFGISGWYATQFMKPQLTDDEIQRLQQADQKLFFRPPDDGVITVAKSINIDSQESKEWAAKLKSLKKGECVTCGSMVRNDKWTKYDPRIIRITSFGERLNHDKE